MNVRGTSGVYELTNVIGSGGEGIIYSVQNNPSIVAKIYKSPKIADPFQSDFLEQKLKIMLRYPVDSMINGQLTVCWPLDILYDASSGLFCGYMMPRVTTGAKHLYSALRERERIQFFPQYTYKTSVIVAYNLACAIYHIHKTGYIIGDMNPSNIFVDRKGCITLIDCDSYTFRDPKTSRIYDTGVGIAEMLAPEYQGKKLSQVHLEKYGDYFSMAIHIFMLLRNNIHPFSGAANNSNGNQIASNIRDGRCPFVRKGHFLSHVNAIPDERILPRHISNLFERAFSYSGECSCSKDVLAKRPTAKEWIVYLKEMIDNMDVCRKDTSHIYPNHLKHCPWCNHGKVVQKWKSKLLIASCMLVLILMVFNTDFHLGMQSIIRPVIDNTITEKASEFHTFIKTVQHRIASKIEKTSKHSEKHSLDYLIEYNRPQELGKNIENGRFSIEGSLYEMPCPVSEFTNNGWKFDDENIIIQPSDIISDKWLYFPKGNGDYCLQVSVTNFSLLPQKITDCVITEITLSNGGKDTPNIKFPYLNDFWSYQEDFSTIMGSLQSVNNVRKSLGIDYYTLRLDRGGYLQIGFDTDINVISDLNYSVITWNWGESHKEKN